MIKKYAEKSQVTEQVIEKVRDEKIIKGQHPVNCKITGECRNDSFSLWIIPMISYDEWSAIESDWCLEQCVKTFGPDYEPFDLRFEQGHPSSKGV